ncbi:MAG: hypothetical protein ACXVCK_07270 [Bdellovibrionota bacterium]
MKKQITIQALYATSLLAISLASISAHAALTKVAQPARTEQAIVEDEITPEAPAADADDEVVVVTKKSASTVVKKKTVVREQTEITPPEAPIQAEAPVVPPAATKPTTGQQLDAGVKAKMEDVQNQFEQALLKSLDRIKISVDDGAPAQGAAAPTQSVVVQDNVVSGQGAPKADYMSVADAPDVKDDGTDASDGQSVGALPKEEKKSERKIHIAPVFGKSNISSSAYNVDSKYTAGIELEMDMDTNFSLVLGYSYSQYDIGLANANPFVGYYQPYGYNGSNTLGYNQNVFEADGRIYLMPREAKFRLFGGVGLGYNLGYLNYTQNGYLQNPSYNPYYNAGTSDYEVKSWMGILSAGGSLNVSENVSIGALFKYDLVFSSSQNQPLNNYAFVNSGNFATSTNQQVVGGSLAQDSFYSILGTVKVAF